VTRQGIGQWACEGGPTVVVVLVIVAIMVEDMDIWVGDVASLTQTTNHDTKDGYAFQYIWVGYVASLTQTTNHDTKDGYAFQCLVKHRNEVKNGLFAWKPKIYHKSCLGHWKSAYHII
jgi:hypothetical protein